jgi:hypothetical protein
MTDIPPPWGSRPRDATRRLRVGPRPLLVVALVAGLALLAGACAPDSQASSNSTVTARPRTSAHLQIESPTPNQTTGSAVDLKLALSGATVVSPSEVSGIDPTEGHIHVSVDGKLVSMTYGLSQQLHLAPGTHTVQAEFVASDHRPFANRVVAAVVFQVT